MTAEELQDEINAIESKYYKGWKQSEEWWQITGNVEPSDRELWIKYNELKRRKLDRSRELDAQDQGTCSLDRKNRV